MKTNLNIVPQNIVQTLLKLGFDYESLYRYNDNGEIVKMDDWCITDNPAPMAETVLQWLREKKNIMIYPIRIGNITIPNMGTSFICYFDEDPEPKYTAYPYETYEEAMIESILFVLKNYFRIENESNNNVMDDTIE